jgi:hypothetical protein
MTELLNRAILPRFAHARFRPIALRMAAAKIPRWE